MKIYLGPGGNCISAKEKGTFGSFGRINEMPIIYHVVNIILF